MVSKSFDILTGNLQPFESYTRRMLLELSPGTLSVILWDKQRQQLDAIEVFNGIFSEREEWEAMLQQSKLMAFTGVETLLLNAYPQAMPIPAFLYTPVLAKEQLQLIHGSDGGWHTSGDVVENSGIVFAWQMPLSFHQLATKHFKLLKVCHVASGILSRYQNLGDTRGFVTVYGGLAWVFLWINGELQFASTVTTVHPEDLSYHLLNICRQFNIEPTQVTWEVSGMAAEGSPLWNAITRFFNNVNSMQVVYGQPDELPRHYFAHLFKSVI